MRRHLKHAMRHAVVAAIAVAFQSWASAAQAESAKAWDAFTHDFIEATFKAQPQFAVWAGRHEFDGKLPDWTPTV